MIIGFTGSKQAGKTTAVWVLEELGMLVRRVNFKDSLIKELQDNFPDLLEYMSNTTGLSVEELFDRKPPMMRKLMQNYGTDVRRKEDDKYWTDRWGAAAATTYETDNAVTVDDVRFLNEATSVRDLGGIIIRIERDGYNGDGHISETEGASIEADYKIKNDGSPWEMSKQLMEIPEIRSWFNVE